MNFKAELEKRTEYAEKVLKDFLPAQEGYQKTVLEAMNYSTLAGGKRLRPVMMEAAYRMFGGTGEVVLPFMAALEMIHNYSLVHDDLECMDNDEYRRGIKTTHVVYGEGMAVLAGDGLLNYAYETAAGAFDKVSKKQEYMAVAKALQVLAAKAGVYGMIGGQCADIEAENKSNPSEKLLLYIHENKTAALIQAALMVGAILAGADETAIREIEKCGYNVGVAFQIQDDILDVTSTTEELGKPVGSDEKNNKVTCVSINGLEKSKEKVTQLSEEAVSILRNAAADANDENELFLEELIRQLIYRKK